MKMHVELLNSLTMYPGMITSLVYLPKLKMGPLSYGLFCGCSAYYHMQNYLLGKDCHNGFVLDIASQHIACYYNTESYYKKTLFLSILYMLYLKKFPKTLSHVCSGTSIILATGMNIPALTTWGIGFVCFGLSRVGLGYMHGVFHMLAHLAMVFVWNKR